MAAAGEQLESLEEVAALPGNPLFRDSYHAGFEGLVWPKNRFSQTCHGRMFETDPRRVCVHCHVGVESNLGDLLSSFSWKSELARS